MTTTGYGDKVPVTPWGRVVAMTWMFASIFLVALFSASLASSFVVHRLTTVVASPNDLARVRVAGVSGTAGELWLNAQRISRAQLSVRDPGDEGAAPRRRAGIGLRETDPRPHDHGVRWRELQVLPHTLAVRDYAIALPTDSPLKEPINRALLKVCSRAGLEGSRPALCRRDRPGGADGKSVNLCGCHRLVMAELVPATPLNGGTAVPHDRGRRDKPGDDGERVSASRGFCVALRDGRSP